MMRTTVSIHLVRLSAVIQLYFLQTSTQQQQSSSHQLKHMITTSFWLIWLADCSLSLCLSVQSWSLSPFSSHSFTEESSHWEGWRFTRKYWIFALILTVFNTILLKPARTDSNSLLTSESPVYSLDSPEDQTAASRPSPSGHFLLDAEISDGMRGWTSELRPEKHSWSLTTCSTSIWIKNKWRHFRKQSSCLKSFNVS